MKKIYLIFILSLIFQITALAQNSTKPNDTQEIQQLIQNSFDSLFSGYRAELLDRFYTPDFLLLEQGEVWDMDFIKTYLGDRSKNPTPVVRTNRFEFIKTEVFGNRAWVAYHNWATFTTEGATPRHVYWLESASAIRTSEGWRLELLHSTRVENQK